MFEFVPRHEFGDTCPDCGAIFTDNATYADHLVNYDCCMLYKPRLRDRLALGNIIFDKRAFGYFSSWTGMPR